MFLTPLGMPLRGFRCPCRIVWQADLCVAIECGYTTLKSKSPNSLNDETDLVQCDILPLEVLYIDIRISKNKVPP